MLTCMHNNIKLFYYYLQGHFGAHRYKHGKSASFKLDVYKFILHKNCSNIARTLVIGVALSGNNIINHFLIF